MSLTDDVARQLARGANPNDVVAMLVKRGLSEAAARRLVERALQRPSPLVIPAPRPKPRDNGMQKLAIGTFFCVLGLAVTAYSFLMARPGGKYTLWWGAVVYGLVTMARGFAAWWQVRDSEPFPALPVGVAGLLPLMLTLGLFVFFRPTRPERKPGADEGIRASLADTLRSAVAALKESDFDKRRAAIRDLKRMGARARPAVSALVAFFHAGDTQLRAEAAEALVAIDPDGPETRAALTTILQGPEPELRIWAGRAIAQLDRNGDVSSLVAELESSNPGARTLAAEQLAQVGTIGPSAIPVLLKHLKEDDLSAVRADCARALGRSDPTTSELVEALQAATEDPDGRVRHYSRSALAALGRRRTPSEVPR